MGRPQNKEFSVRQTLLSLGVVFILAGIAILSLSLLHKSALVELDLLVEEAHFTVLPNLPDGHSMEVFAPQIQLTKMEFREFDRLSATLGDPVSKRVSLGVAEEGRIRIRSSAPLGSPSPFSPTLKFSGPLRVELAPESRGGITFRLIPLNKSAMTWECEIIPRRDLEAVFRDVIGLAGVDAAGLDPDAPPVYVSGGAKDSQISLSLAEDVEASTTITLLDLEMGTLTEKLFPVRLPGEESLVAIGGRLVSIVRRSPDPKNNQFLVPNLRVQEIAFFRLHGFEEQSFILRGKINFPGGEKESIQLEEDSILSIPKDAEFKLKSVQILDSGLRLVLWGKSSSVKVGPNLDLMEEALPSIFSWLSTHRLGAFVFTTLGAIVGSTIGLLRLLGLVRQ